jgi:hypothetical protein
MRLGLRITGPVSGPSGLRVISTVLRGVQSWGSPDLVGAKGVRAWQNARRAVSGRLTPGQNDRRDQEDLHEGVWGAESAAER